MMSLLASTLELIPPENLKINVHWNRVLAASPASQCPCTSSSSLALKYARECALELVAWCADR
jgi:hypothetical protein